MLIIFANSLDPDQDQQNLYPDLDLNCLNPLTSSADNLCKQNVGPDLDPNCLSSY